MEQPADKMRIRRLSVRVLSRRRAARNWRSLEPWVISALLVLLCLFSLLVCQYVVRSQNFLFPGVYFAVQTDHSWELIKEGQWSTAFNPGNHYYPPFYYDFLIPA